MISDVRVKVDIEKKEEGIVTSGEIKTIIEELESETTDTLVAVSRGETPVSIITTFYDDNQPMPMPIPSLTCCFPFRVKVIE